MGYLISCRSARRQSADHWIKTWVSKPRPPALARRARPAAPRSIAVITAGQMPHMNGIQFSGAGIAVAAFPAWSATA